MNGISSAVWADMQAVKKWNMEVTRLLAVSPARRVGRGTLPKLPLTALLATIVGLRADGTGRLIKLPRPPKPI